MLTERPGVITPEIGVACSRACLAKARRILLARRAQWPRVPGCDGATSCGVFAAEDTRGSFVIERASAPALARTAPVGIEGRCCPSRRIGRAALPDLPSRRSRRAPHQPWDGSVSAKPVPSKRCVRYRAPLLQPHTQAPDQGFTNTRGYSAKPETRSRHSCPTWASNSSGFAVGGSQRLLVGTVPAGLPVQRSFPDSGPGPHFKSGAIL